MTVGRKAGYKHLEETKAKISNSRSGNKHSAATKAKISRSMSSLEKTSEHKNRIASSMYDLDGKCTQRLEELKLDYPEQSEFFTTNEPELLFAMRGLRSEKELNDIRKYKETKELNQIRDSLKSYQYSSSSCYAAEDAIIELLDFKRSLQKIS